MISTDGALTVTGGVGNGTWYIDPTLLTGYFNFVLDLKDGNADPNWAAFELGANALLTVVTSPGTWFAVSGGTTLSICLTFGSMPKHVQYCRMSKPK